MSERSEIHLCTCNFSCSYCCRGYQMVYEGWKSFEETSSEVGVGELPQLLRYLKMATTPTPTATPTKMEPKEEAEEDGGGSRINSWYFRAVIEKPIHISVGGKTKMYKVWELRHYPQMFQNGYGFPHLCCPHKEGPSVLLHVHSACIIWIHSNDMRGSYK